MSDGIAREANRIVHRECDLTISRLRAENQRLREALRELKRTLDKLDAADVISITWLPGISTLLNGNEVGDE